MALVARASDAGRVCAGEYLPSGKASLEMAKYYKTEDANFLMAAPISQIVLGCCAGCVVVLISCCCIGAAAMGAAADLENDFAQAMKEQEEANRLIE